MPSKKRKEKSKKRETIGIHIQSGHNNKFYDTELVGFDKPVEIGGNPDIDPSMQPRENEFHRLKARGTKKKP